MIFGSLLDALSLALRDHLAAAGTDDKPRMADFAALGAAAAPALGWTAADFRNAYQANREQAVDRVLEADPVAEAIIEFARQAYSWKDRSWKGTKTQLLETIGKLVADETRREKTWPKDGARLSGRLRRAAPALRSRGITMRSSREEERLAEGPRVRRIVTIQVAADVRPAGETAGASQNQ